MLKHSTRDHSFGQQSRHGKQCANAPVESVMESGWIPASGFAETASNRRLPNKIMKKGIFFPPAVQAKTHSKLGHCPNEASEKLAAEIEAVWERRNTAPDSELEDIDCELERLAFLAATE